MVQAADGSLGAQLFRVAGIFRSGSPELDRGVVYVLRNDAQSYFTQRTWADMLDRLRLTYDGKYESWLQVHVDFDNELHAGNLIRLPDFEMVRGRQGAVWLDLQHTILERSNVYWDTSLYRGYVPLHAKSAALTLGRQRIGWGTARFWSPMDVFNPINPLQVEPEERATSRRRRGLRFRQQALPGRRVLL